jgi:hypothetical protein
MTTAGEQRSAVDVGIEPTTVSPATVFETACDHAPNPPQGGMSVRFECTMSA